MKRRLREHRAVTRSRLENKFGRCAMGMALRMTRMQRIFAGIRTIRLIRWEYTFRINHIRFPGVTWLPPCVCDHQTVNANPVVFSVNKLNEHNNCSIPSNLSIFLLDAIPWTGVSSNHCTSFTTVLVLKLRARKSGGREAGCQGYQDLP